MMFNPANFINPLNNLGAVDNATLAQGLSGGNYSLASTPASTSIDKLTQQILGQNLTSKWSGQGHGSAEANARDMARIMFDAGITDIKQFGQFERPVTINQPVRAEFTDDGSPTGRFINDATGKYADNVQYVSDGVDQMVPVTAVQSTEKVFGNKETKQPFAQTYASDPTAWGGTYAGKGNTGYRVHFGEDGTPYFYTTGGSSSDLGSIAPFLAIASFVPGVAPFAAAANAAIAIDQGNVLGGLASLAGIPGVSEAAKVAGLGSAVSGIQTANQINNIVKAAESGNVLGALTAGANVAGMGGVQLGDTGLTVSDVLKTANAIDALDKGNFGSLISTLAPSGGLSGPKSSDFEEGYFRPGGAGYDDPDNIDAGGGWNPANVVPQFPTIPTFAQQPTLPDFTVPTQAQMQTQNQGLADLLAPYAVSQTPPPSSPQVQPQLPQPDMTVPTQDQMQTQNQGLVDLLAPYAAPQQPAQTLDTTAIAPDNTGIAPGVQNMDDFDNIDVGGGWNPAGISSSFDDSFWRDVGEIDAKYGSIDVPDLSSLPSADYSNEGRNYPTPDSTQGPGGSPINASLRGGSNTLSRIRNALRQPQAGNVTGLGLLAALGGIAGIKSLLEKDRARYGVPGRRDWTGPVSQYNFNPSMFQPTTVNPAMFRPTGVPTAKQGYAAGGYAGGGISDLGSYSDGGRLLRGPGDGVSDSIPATIGHDRPARLADGEFVIPARIVSELGNGSTEAGARQLYAMMDRIQKQRAKTTSKGQVAKDTKAAKQLPA